MFEIPDLPKRRSHWPWTLVLFGAGMMAFGMFGFLAGLAAALMGAHP